MLKYSPACADSTHRCFDNFDRFLNRTHELFDEIERSLRTAPDDAALQHAKLAVHEWLANLIQHADFDDRTPEVVLGMTLRGSQVQITIEDNSQGFDLDAQIQAQQGGLTSFPDRGMGLLTIRACTQHLSYIHLAPDQHCLAFSVSAGQYPILRLPFATPEHLSGLPASKPEAAG